MKRYLETHIRRDLAKKMVFVGGPRQVGKTTMAKNIALHSAGSDYLNWDNRDHKKNILGMYYSSDLV